MTAPPQSKPFISPEDYIEREKTAELKHEYYQGEIFAMSGGTLNHASLAVNMSTALSNALLEKGCRVFSSDLRVHVEAFGLYTYPDVSVVCGEVETTEDGLSLLNPTLLVEVLSPSTEPYDRGQKFRFYRGIPSLREYVLVAQERRSIEVFRRNEENRWTLYEPEDGAIALASVDAVLQLDAVYAGVELPENPPLHGRRDH